MGRRCRCLCNRQGRLLSIQNTITPLKVFERVSETPGSEGYLRYGKRLFDLATDATPWSLGR